MKSTGIVISAAVIIDNFERILLVRKKNTKYFMQPGGKVEIGESPVACLKRELSEELGKEYSDDNLLYIGKYFCMAANEADTLLTADLFLIRDSFNPSIRAEIAEVDWVPIKLLNERVDLAPLTRDHVLPIAQNIILSDCRKNRR